MGIGISLVLAGAALLASGILFAHKRITTYLAAAAVIWQGAWLLLTFIDRVILTGLPPRYVFWGGAALFLLVALAGWRKWQRPPWGMSDLPVTVVIAVVVLAAWSVVINNGWRSDGSWVTHGFYNGDTATFAALVNKSFLTDELVRENPFAGNVALEYPTLLHGGMAQLLRFLGGEEGWLTWLPLMTVGQILITVPLFFLLWDVVSPELWGTSKKPLGISRKWLPWLMGAVVLYVLMFSWDGYVYPQSHFFLTGLFLLAAALFGRASRESGAKQYFCAASAWLAVIVLVLSNAVTGTAAAALAIVFGLLWASQPKRSLIERLSYFGGVLVVTLVFLFATPGEPAFGLVPGFSYTAASGMVRYVVALGFVFIGLLQILSRQPLWPAVVAVLSAMAFGTFVFSSRDIVVDNASRFFYQALLLGFPFALAPLIQSYFWVKRELVHTARAWPARVSGWVLIVCALGWLLLPAAESVASAHDNLLFKDEQSVSAAEVEALVWIQRNTEADAVWLARPDAPFAIPLFTGRSLLRTNYWLSPDDVTLSDVNVAFLGDLSAQEQVTRQADYLYVGRADRAAWQRVPFELVFANEEVTIYSLR